MNNCNNLVCTCPLPSAWFSNLPPISGIYKTIFVAKKQILFLNEILFEGYSNEIIVSRFDDNSECKCESNPETINVDCNQLNALHEGIPSLFIPAQDVKLRAKTLLTANCNITPNNYNVTFVAGNTVSLTQGFSSGNNFRAYLDKCDDGIIVQRIEHNNDNDTLQNTTEAFKTIFEDFEKQIIIYPNPNLGTFNIELAEPQENTTLQIYNTFGQLMLQQQINTNQHQIDVSTFGKGI